MIEPKQILPLFPIAVGCYHFGDVTELRDRVREYIKDRPFNQNNDNPNLKHYLQKGDNTDGSVNINDGFFNHFSDTGLEEFFNETAYHFHTTILGLSIQSPYRVVDAWVNHCSQGSQPFHAHINSFLSGTFYLDHDETAAPIEFVNPSVTHQIEPAISFTPDYNNTTIFSQPAAQIKPEPGDFLLWQSHIRHGFTNNQSPNRLSLSVNMIPQIVFSNRYGFEVSPITKEWN